MSPVGAPELKARLAVDSRCEHGEGVIWDERRQALFWVDISGRRLWAHEPASGRSRDWALPDRPGCLGLVEDGRLVVVLAKSIGIVEPDLGSDALAFTHLAGVEPDQPHTRSNDGRVDRDGHLVFGTMDEHDEKAARGSFYQFSLRHGLRRLPLPGVSIPNAICFSRDGRTMYWCDSVTPRIYCCDYDAASAQTANVREFARLDRYDAEPDGATIDADGLLWNAQWRAWRVQRFGADGSVERTVEMPVKHPTCVAFGGPALDRLYIISSRLDHAEDELRHTPQAGGLFACDAGVTGLPEGRMSAA